MLRPCILTGPLLKDDDLESGFKKIHDAGFHCVDLDLDVYLPGNKISSGEFTPFYEKSIDELCEFFTRHKELAKKYDIEFTQAHAPFQLYVDGRDDINEKCVEIVEKCTAICAFLDCKYLVVHPISLAFIRDRDYERKTNIEYYAKFIPFLKKYGVVICLENMFSVVSRVVTEAVCSDVTETVNYIDTLNKMAGEELFGFCFDLGHMTLLGKHIRASIDALGSRIKVLHLHDNDNIQDNHGLPYSYARTWGQYALTDWQGLLDGLRDIGYRGEIDFEIGAGLSIIPEPVRVAALKYVYAVGEYFASEILKQ
ncbi:MAG: sugar phosphate isomerase/epimerase [Clostridia bacterium]|nr:sugar phosphate isomerase/epimerase [Clostridia bacterium]